MRPGPPYRIAAQKLSQLPGVELNEEQLDRLTLAFHYGLAIQWAPLYPILRRHTNLGPVAAGLATGTALSVVADERSSPRLSRPRPSPPSPSSTAKKDLQ